MKIVDIKKLAEHGPSEDCKHKEYMELQQKQVEAEELVETYEEYKSLLSKSVMKRIKKWLSKNKLGFGLLCKNGHLNSVTVRQKEVNIRDLSGEIIDEDDVKESEPYCGRCGDNEDCIINIGEFLEETKKIDEFAEYHKLFKAWR